MKTFITTIMCIFCCLNYITTNKNSFNFNEDKKQKFESFINKFDIYCKPYIDEGFFMQRDERSCEMYTEIDKQKFSIFIPNISECNCEKEEFYYRPCFKIDKINFYIVAILASCDIPKSDGYPFDANLLVTYDKTGNIIDYKIVGIGSDVEQYKMICEGKENELTITQHSFKEITTAANKISGKCDVLTYSIGVNDNGAIEKEIISEYEDNLTMEL